MGLECRNVIGDWFQLGIDQGRQLLLQLLPIVCQIRAQLLLMVCRILLQLLPKALTGPRSPAAPQKEHDSQPDQPARQEKIENSVSRHHANAYEDCFSEVLPEESNNDCEDAERSRQQPRSVVQSFDSFRHETSTHEYGKT